MTMHCVALRHVPFEDLGLFEPVLKQRGYEVEYVQAGPMALSEQDWLDADLVVVLGGPIGVADIDAYPWLGDEIAGIRQRLSCRRPLLGLCLGAQLMAAALGARVAPLPNKEIGWAPVTLTAEAANSPLRHLAGLDMLHWHGDAFDLPTGATLLASTPLTHTKRSASGFPPWPCNSTQRSTHRRSSLGSSDTAPSFKRPRSILASCGSRLSCSAATCRNGLPPTC